MKSISFILFVALASLASVTPALAQTTSSTQAVSGDSGAAVPSEHQEKKAAEWVGALKLSSPAKEQRLQTLIARHLMEVRNWHNAHSYTLVPAGMNPETGQPLSKLDRQMIVDSSMPDSVHQHFIQGLQQDLTEEGVNQILDDITIGKVTFTMKGYEAIVPDLTTAEKTAIHGFLAQARERAVDYKNMKEISAVFEIYKTKCEGYLNTHGRNWRSLYKAYYKKIQAAKKNKS